MQHSLWRLAGWAVYYSLSRFPVASTFAIGGIRQAIARHSGINRGTKSRGTRMSRPPPFVNRRLSALATKRKEDDASKDLPDQESTRTKIVVVGAGISGLSVAYNLWKLSSSCEKTPNLDIEILEVRDRIGGRVQPVSIDKENDVWFDLGGQWLHESSPENPIRRLMEDDLGIGFTDKKNNKHKKLNRFHKRKRKNVLFDETGRLLDMAAVQRARKIFYKAVEDLDDERDARRLGGDLQTKDRDSISFRDLLDRRTSFELGGSDHRLNDPRLISSFEKAMSYFVHRAEGYEGGHFEEVSAYLANNLYDEFGGPDRVVEGSYKSLLDALTSKMGLESIEEDDDDNYDGHFRIRIRENARVQRIDYTNNSSNTKQKVSLSVVENKQCTRGLECDYCVCTVPLGVLQQRKIEFCPPLSKARQKAIDSIGMGLLNKIVFRFDFDPDDAESDSTDSFKFWGNLQQFGICHEDPALVKTYYDCTCDHYYDYNYDYNNAANRRSAILVQFLAGSPADRIDPPISAPFEGITDQQAIDESLEALRTVFGADNVPNPSVAKVTRWRRDPWSCGSYSFAKIGASPNMYDEIATPLANRLMFAGEHTSKHRHSTVHGAWETGEREARRIFYQLRG